VLDLLANLRRELDLSLIFISHDLGATRALCSELLVLYAGRCVQRGPLAALDSAPVHPYTRLLMDSVPQMRPGWLDTARVAPALAGSDAHVDAAGGALCAFRSRCAARIEGLCDRVAPPLRRDPGGTERLCHLEQDSPERR
jgi:peptide/nickel transport system ATP-binding protein